MRDYWRKMRRERARNFVRTYETPTTNPLPSTTTISAEEAQNPTPLAPFATLVVEQPVCPFCIAGQLRITPHFIEAHVDQIPTAVVVWSGEGHCAVCGTVGPVVSIQRPRPHRVVCATRPSMILSYCAATCGSIQAGHPKGQRA